MTNFTVLKRGGGSVSLCSALCTRLRGCEDERTHERGERGWIQIHSPRLRCAA